MRGLAAARLIFPLARDNHVPEISNAHRDLAVKFARACQKSLDWAFNDPKTIDDFAEGKRRGAGSRRRIFPLLREDRRATI